MKKYTLSFCLLLLSLAACRDFLNREPVDQVSNDEALRNIEGLRTALIGAYEGLSAPDYYRRFMLAYPEFAGGNLRINTRASANITVVTFNNIYQFTNTAQDNNIMTRAYGSIYQAINRSNNIIQALPNITSGTAAERQSILGEALCIRALAHFDALRLYAQAYRFSPDASHIGIAVLRRTPGTLEYPRRSSVREGYALVIEDLQQAIALLPIQAPRGGNAKAWWTRYAAQALLARVYLYMGQWQEAFEAADEVLRQGGYQLVGHSSFLEQWGKPGNNNPEIIFELDLSAVPNIANGTTPQLYGTGNEQPIGVASTDIINLYNTADIRGRDFLMPTNGSGDVLSAKFPNTLGNTVNLPLLRLAELYLIRAEAAAELGNETQALSDLNTLRQRANPAAALLNQSGEALKAEIQLERRRELAFEGHLLFDLTRRGQSLFRNDCNSTITRCNINYPSTLFVLPIPQAQLDANPATQQNEGY
jgi:tetratricopeptide (TPR) repeat protein